jgi:hypothetical protein
MPIADYRGREVTQILDSWARIPLRTRIFLCVYSVSVSFLVEVEAFRQADAPSKKYFQLCTDQETESAAKLQYRAVEPGWIDIFHTVVLTRN